MMLLRNLVTLTAYYVSFASAAPGTIMDSAGGSFKVQNIPSSVQTSSLVAVISSPGTTPSLVESNEILELDETNNRLVCRGATLSGASDAERTSLAACSLIASTIVLDGITVGDIEAGLQNTRHARTLTAFFKTRVKLQEAAPAKQTLLLAVLGDEEFDEKEVLKAVKSLYDAVAVERKNSASFGDVYSVKTVSASDAQQVLSMASDITSSAEVESKPLAAALTDAQQMVRDSGIEKAAIDPPHISQAFITVSHAFNGQSRAARARIAAWKSRVARGLWVDGFGREAEALRKRVLGTFDGATLSATGLPLVAPYRLELRSQLQTLVDTALEELFAAQVSNLERSTLKRLERQLLKTISDPAESVVDSNAAAMRKEAFNFETVVEDLELPNLGLTKEKAAREMSAKLNDALMSFPDSPAAKIQRTKQVSKVVNRERKPSRRAVDWGVDLVAVLRPDGFGSLQGFAGYQLGGHSLTFGVHNDADDPQVIAQFGGVRPPLLRVQPKLRLDVDL